jgi:hypothetical protein
MRRRLTKAIWASMSAMFSKARIIGFVGGLQVSRQCEREGRGVTLSVTFCTDCNVQASSSNYCQQVPLRLPTAV